MALKRIKAYIDHYFKKILSLYVYYRLRKSISVLNNWLQGKQLMMVLDSDKDIPERNIPGNLCIKTYDDINDPCIWIDIVNDSLGDWDKEKAQYLFFSDNSFSPDLCLFLYKDHEPVATASCRIKSKYHQEVGELHMVAVKKEYYGKGYGNAISTEVIRYLKRQFKGKIILSTDDWRIPAIKLYWKIGFRPLKKVGWSNHHKRWDKIMHILKHNSYKE